MGAQLTKSSRNSTGQQLSLSSDKQRPFTTSITTSDCDSKDSPFTSSKISQIVVVNAGPTPISQSSSSFFKRLPILLRPLIPIGQVQVDSNYPQLQAQTIIDLGLDLEQELRIQAEFIAREQIKLIDKIRDIDQQVTASSVTIGAERQRRFNKAVDNFAKFDEIDHLINRCETDIENILSVFLQLNEVLPENLSLEAFALQI